MYSYDVDFRVRLFDDINAYKRVDALGKSRNQNPNASTDRKTKNFMDSAVEKYKPYKFVICCENKLYPGYVTEKIINGMLANAIPIYYGASDISSHFNPKSFINIGSFGTRREAIEFIKRVDQDDALYCQILQEPWFNNNTPTKYFEPSYATSFFKNIRHVSRQRQSTIHRRTVSSKYLSPQKRIIQRFTTMKRHLRVANPVNKSNLQRTRHMKHTARNSRLYSSRSPRFSHSPSIRKIRFPNRRRVGNH